MPSFVVLVAVVLRCKYVFHVFILLVGGSDGRWIECSLLTISVLVVVRVSRSRTCKFSRPTSTVYLHAKYHLLSGNTSPKPADGSARALHFLTLVVVQPQRRGGRFDAGAVERPRFDVRLSVTPALFSNPQRRCATHNNYGQNPETKDITYFL